MIKGKYKRNIIKEMLNEICCGIKYFIKMNLYNFGVLLEMMNPYILCIVIYMNYQKRGCLAFGGELFIPIVIYILSKIIKRLANKFNAGYDIPIPRKRFTHDVGNGEVTVDNEDLQEMLLFMYDYEEYLKRTGRKEK